MPRALKISLILVSGLTAILGILILMAHVLVSRQDHQFLRQQIEARTLAAIGFQLQVRGPFELPYSLAPTVVFRDIVIDNPEYKSETSLLEADELRVRFGILPLLRGEVLVYESSLTAVKLNLEVDEDGEENWITGKQAGSATGLAAQLAVHTVDLHQLGVTYRNKATGTDFQVGLTDINLRAPLFDDQIQVRMLADYLGTPIEISGSLGSGEDILSGNAFPIDLDVDIYDVDIDVSGRIDRIEGGEFSNLLLRLDVEGSDMGELEGLAGVSLPDTSHFSATSTLSLDGDSIVISNLLAEVGWLDSKLEIAGNVARVEELDGFDITVSVSGSNARQMSAIHDLPWMPQTDAYELAGTVRGRWPEFEVTEIHAHVERDDIVASAAGAVMDVFDLSGIDMDVSVRGDDLGDLAEFTRHAMPRTHAWQIEGRVYGAWPALSLSAADVRLRRDDLELDLSGGIEDLAAISGLDIGIVARGSDLAQIPELGDYDLPTTDSFDVDARLQGDPDSISATIGTATARRGSHEAVLAGKIGALAAFDDVDLQLQARGGNAAELNALIGLNVPPTHNYRLTSDLAGGTDGISASNLVLVGEMPGARLDIRGSVGRILDLHDVDLMIQAGTDDLSSLIRYVNFRLPVSEPFEVTGRLRGTVPELTFDDFTIQSGRSLVNGSVSVHMLDRTFVEGSLSSGVIDLTPWLIAARDDAQDKATSPSDRVFSAEPIDLSFLDHFDARMTLDNLELWSSADNAHVEQATVALVAGSLSVEPLRMTRDDAMFSVHFLLDRKAAPRYELEMTAENVNLATFLRDVRAREFYEGRFDLALDLESGGDSPRELAANLNGTGAAFVSEARVPQVSTVLRSIDIIFELLPWVKRQEDITVDCAISQVEVEQGIVNVNLLYLDAAQVTMVGGGRIDLREEKLDLRFAPRPKKRRFLAHNIDITMRGSLADPTIATAGATKAAATAYGKYALIGPFGLLVPTSRAKTHPCVGSVQEYREQQAEAE